jgi:hypothetical protein
MPRRDILPAGLVPRFLSRDEAAAYVGVSANVWDSEVRAGWWPPPLRRGAMEGRLTWDRHLIDTYADRRSGLTAEKAITDPAADPLAVAEAIALERCYGPAPKQRRQAGRPQAA